MSQRSSVRAGRAAAGSNGRRRRSGIHTRTTNGIRHRHRRGLRIALFIVALFSALGVVGVGIIYAEYVNFKNQLPDAATLKAMEPPIDSHVYDRAGNLIGVLHNSDFRHEHIAIGNVSIWAKEATVDVEDKHFYENSSWDLGRIIKAGWENLRHQANAGGASTITEQLAKISFLSPERSLDRKIKQVILGAEIESNFSKPQILEMYLNRIAYGNHAIGIETAARLYFQKSAHDLDLAEASMLAGLPNSPTTFNPLNHDPGVDVNPLAKQRQHVVLQAMVSAGDITTEQADKAYAEKLTYYPWEQSEPYTYPNFRQFLVDWLNVKFGDQYIKPGGWDIYTTIDPVKQKLAQDAVTKGVAAIDPKDNAHDGALVSMDPKTGEILAMVGSSNPDDKTINIRNLAYEPRQPGSTIKLFTYTAAIASRQFTMTTPILDAPISLPAQPKPYTPLNYDRQWHGTCQLQQCLGNSFNVPAVKVEVKVGIPLITDLEIATGLKELADPGSRPWATLWPATLGGIPNGISPLELADGVSTIADLGVQHDPVPVTRITGRTDHKVIYAHDPLLTGRQVVPADVAFIMNEITSNDHNRYREFGPSSMLTLKDRRVSAKTGTTENFSSNWTVGWTPDLVSVVFVGNPNQSCLNGEKDAAALQALLRRRGDKTNVSDTVFTAAEVKGYGFTPLPPPCGPLEYSTGITGAAPIWNQYMKTALANTPKHWYTKPADVIGSSKSDDGDFFLPGTQAPCYYYAPEADPNNYCTYSGPYVPPAATPSPAPGAATPTPAPAGGGDQGNPTPTPKPHP